MPSSYVPPDVQVTQVRKSASAPRITPPLAVVVVGPAADVKYREYAGDYVAGDPLGVPFPGLSFNGIVDRDSVEVFLDTVAPNGRSIGIFKLTEGVDYTIVNDVTTGNPARVDVVDSFGLEYSLLSKANNAGDSLTPDYAIATASALTLTDEAQDFYRLSGDTAVTTDGTAYVNILEPADAAGQFKITGASMVNGAVNTLDVEEISLVNGGIGGVKLDLALTIGATDSNRTRVVAVPTGHQHISATSYLTGAGAAGCPVSAVVRGGVATTTSDFTYAIGAFEIKLNTSTGVAAGLAGLTLPPLGAGGNTKLRTRPTAYTADFWRSIVTSAKIGDYVRVKISTSPGTAVIRDFRVTNKTLDDKVSGTDTANAWTLEIVDPDGTAGTGSNIVLLATAGVSDYAASDIALFGMVRSRSNNIIGETLVVSGSKYEVIGARPGVLILASAVPTGAGGRSASVKRGIKLRNTELKYDIVQTLAAGYTARTLISYTAARADLALQGLIECGSTADVEAQIGLINPSNPLALGTEKALRGSGGAVVYALSTESDTIEGYSKALEYLEGREDVYYLVPLSQDKDIIDLFVAHARTMSRPENKGERIVLANTALKTFDYIAPNGEITAGADAIKAAVHPSNLDQLVERSPTPGVNPIPWDDIKVGDAVWLADATTGARTTLHRISALVPNTSITVQPALTGVGTGANVLVRFETWTRTKLQQAEAWRDEASGYAGEGGDRLVMVRPDEEYVQYTDRSTGKPVDQSAWLPGFYTACSVAGFRSSLPPQRPITNTGIPGVGEIRHSNNYFTPSQLNTVAEGGNFILTQRLETAPATVKHQLTADMTSIETQELSIRILVDYAAKVMRTGLRPYIGKHNITSEFLVQLRGIAEALLRALVDAGVVRKGSQITRVAQRSDRPDEVDIDVSLLIPYPCNRINVTLAF